MEILKKFEEILAKHKEEEEEEEARCRERINYAFSLYNLDSEAEEFIRWKIFKSGVKTIEEVLEFIHKYAYEILEEGKTIS